jgi:hypothetical protein
MFSLLIFAILLSLVIYVAGFKLHKRKRILITGITFSIFGILPVAFMLFGNDLISCWAYYDQCTAKRITGLSIEECEKRKDNIAYLYEGGVCLVKQE